MKPFSVQEAVKAVGGKSIGRQGNKLIQRVITDSRMIQPGDLFIPLRGENFDGHHYLSQAFEKGAVCCLSEEAAEVPDTSLLILVPDTKKALLDLAGFYRRQFSIPVIGITGSVGKTTTKDMIASVLSQKYEVLKTTGNFNNEIGLPLTIFQLEEQHEVAVLEMGMNHFGEIHRLSDAARPDLAVITNIGVSHIENLGSREGILKAKTEIFDFMSEDGIAILNADDTYLFSLMGKTKWKSIWYGIESKLDFYAESIHSCGLSGSQCMLRTGVKAFPLEISVPGFHMVQNALAAAAVGTCLGLSESEIQEGIKNFIPTKMRMAIKKTAYGLTVIDDTYNANPISMKAAIDVLASAEGVKTAILGDMLELGAYTVPFHQEIGVYCAKKKLQQLFCIGRSAQEIAKSAKENGMEKVYCYRSLDDFLAEIESRHLTGTVLVKASHSLHLEKIVEKLHEVKK